MNAARYLDISWCPRLGTKGADLQEMSDTNFSYLANQSVLVQEIV